MEWFKNNSKNIKLLFITIIILLIIIEFGFRIYHFSSVKNNLQKAYDNPVIPLPGSKVTLGNIIRPSIYGKIIYELKPNLDVYYRNAHVKTNTLGYRDKEFSTQKNSIRIAGIGDSFMFGWGVNEEQRYMDILELKLNEKYPQHNWETQVFAVPGYSLFMQVEQIEKYVVNYNPDLIIYGYTGNDVCLPTFIRETKSFFSTESFMIQYLRKYLDNTVRLFFKPYNGKEYWEVCDASEAPIAYRKYVGKSAFFREFLKLKQFNIPILILMHNPLPINKTSDYYYLDLQYNYSNPDMVISPKDGHPSIKGHELIAEDLLTQIEDHNIINAFLE